MYPDSSDGAGVGEATQNEVGVGKGDQVGVAVLYSCINGVDVSAEGAEVCEADVGVSVGSASGVTQPARQASSRQTSTILK